MYVRVSCLLVLYRLHCLLVVLTGKCFPTSRSRTSSGTPLTPDLTFARKSGLPLLFISPPTVSCLTRASRNESCSHWPPLFQIHIIKLFTMARSMTKYSRRCHHLSERLPIAYHSRLWSKRSTPPIVELCFATAAGQWIIDDVPSLFFRFTDVICLGLWYVDRTVTGLLSCHFIAATHPLVRNMNSPRWIRSFLFSISWSPFLLLLTVLTAKRSLSFKVFKSWYEVKKFPNAISLWEWMYVSHRLSNSLSTRENEE